MKFFFDFLPLVLFFAAFKFYGVFVATAVIIVTTTLQAAWQYWKFRRIDKMLLATAVIVLLFGGLTLLFHDAVFIKWKPTLVYWLFAAIFLGSQYFSEKPVLAHLLGEQMKLPDKIWRQQNMSWAVFFICMGLLNLYVAFYFAPERTPEERLATWVNFKVFGAIGLTLVFVFVQALFMAKHMPETKTKREEE